MDDNEKNPPQEPKSDKKLQLDLSEALTHGFDDDDDIIELKDEVSPPPTAEEAKINLNDQMNEDMQGDEPAVAKIIDMDALSEETDDEENVVHLAADLAFDEEDEDKAAILPLVDEQPLRADDTNEVVEITEFDDILSEDSNEMMTLSDVSEELEPEEEFLELIDVEEDDLTEEDNVLEMDEESEREEIEDDIILFDGPGADVEDAELEDFINDSFGEEIRIDDDFEDDLTSTLGVEAESEINLADPSSGKEEFDFDMDSSEISEKIDQLDTIFFDESAAEAELDEDAEPEAETIEAAVSDTGDQTETEDIEIAAFFDESEAEAELAEDAESEAEAIEAVVSDTGDETDEISERIDKLDSIFFDDTDAEAEFGENAAPDAEAVEAPESDFDDSNDEIETEDVGVAGGESSDVPLTVGGIAALDASHDQIEKAIERIIEQNFSGKIESMITDIIEKAVSKEIKRLKSILLEADSDENF